MSIKLDDYLNILSTEEQDRVTKLTKGLQFIGDGRNRKAYRHKGYVIKVPLNVFGMLDNEIEAKAFKRYGEEFPYARCKLIGVCLVMEYVEHTWEKNLPDWVMSIDCGQVGYNRKGKLLAYDYGKY